MHPCQAVHAVATPSHVYFTFFTSCIAQITHTTSSEFDTDVFHAVVQFNKHCLKTNFYKATKTCLVRR